MSIIQDERILGSNTKTRNSILRVLEINLQGCDELLAARPSLLRVPRAHNSPESECNEAWANKKVLN